MFLIPAIDLRDGACVRLEQGDFSRDTRYADDPLMVARQFADHGRRAASGGPGRGARRAIAPSGGAWPAGPRNVTPVEFGGGLRDLEAIGRALDAGASRVVLGTAAIENPDLLAAACAAHGDRIAVGIDARKGLVAVRAWLTTSDISVLQLAAAVTEVGCRRIIYTDIATDGMLSGPNLPALRSLLAAVTVPVTASGGIANQTHLKELAEAGAESAIAGKALYSGSLPLTAIADWDSNWC